MSSEVTDQTFKSDVLDSDIPVIVDFWAPWCGPCKALSPIIDSIGVDHPEVKVVKINVDDNEDTAEAYGITSIPAVYMFVGGKPVKKIMGAKPKPAYEHEFAEYFD